MNIRKIILFAVSVIFISAAVISSSSASLPTVKTNATLFWEGTMIYNQDLSGGPLIREVGHPGDDAPARLIFTRLGRADYLEVSYSGRTPPQIFLANDGWENISDKTYTPIAVSESGNALYSVADMTAGMLKNGYRWTDVRIIIVNWPSNVTVTGLSTSVKAD